MDDKTRTKFQYSRRTLEIVNNLRVSYNIEDQAGREILENLREIYHVKELARIDLKNNDGSMVKDRFSQLKPHPSISVMKDCNNQIVQHLKALGIKLNHVTDQEEDDDIEKI